MESRTNRLGGDWIRMNRTAVVKEWMSSYAKRGHCFGIF
jgi:hypothetical protein